MLSPWLLCTLGLIVFVVGVVGVILGLIDKAYDPPQAVLSGVFGVVFGLLMLVAGFAPKTLQPTVPPEAKALEIEIIQEMIGDIHNRLNELEKGKK